MSSLPYLLTKLSSFSGGELLPNQKLGTAGAMVIPGSGVPGPSFFRRISITFRWWLECNSLENVGLHAGRYSGKSRPDLYRTPHALQRVLAPFGPVLH